jgi:glycosyltransferase involved in cell wall biosynthesis
MNILMTADTVGGVWTYALDLIRTLPPHHYNVTLATMGAAPSRAQRRVAAALSHLHLCESSYKLEWMDEPWADVEEAGHWLLQLSQAVQPAIVHLNGYVHAALPWQAPVIVVAHSCVASWWRAVKGEAAPPTYDRYRCCVAAGLRAANLVVAPTQAMLAALVQEYGPLRRTRVIANGRDASCFAPAAAKEPFVFSVGRLWDEAKNVAALDAAAAKLAWPVRLAGAATHPGGAVLTLHHAQAEGVLTPQEISQRLARASIFALPARYEPFGLAVLEAALSGCALVLGDIPSLRENWQRAALFVAPDDPHALHDALARLIDDAATRQWLAAAARDRARHFTLRRMGEAYAACYGQEARQPKVHPMATRPASQPLRQFTYRE